MGHKAYQYKAPKKPRQNTWIPVSQEPPRNNQRNDNKPINMIRIRDDHNPPKEVQQGLQETKELSQAAIQEQRAPTVAQWLKEPYIAENAEGQAFAYDNRKISREIDHLKIFVNGRNQTADFDIVPIKNYDIILGKPWLYQYNPLIN
ncbi:hypothetical protein DL764_002323 [Monosporascus ibericus]|uniref:Uncharacterized protein n=1 Tax=Monosporascus ibericus TaxID=155417 RepID=A0A4Q4TKW5_9PEZI|nr:hypothetical protein DL764_002323 [Monosporascus ibericus]